MFTKLASCRERMMMNYASSPDSLQHRYFGHQHNSLNHVKLESDEEYVKGKKSKFKGRFKAPEAARRLGFRYLTSCFSYIKESKTILRVCCFALFDGDDSKRPLGYDEVMLVDPYFVNPSYSFHLLGC
ncbi:hypothetical protein ACE6H2_016166 [Prunus campanulata]